MKLSDRGRGYLCFSYCKDGKITTLQVHICVAKVFLGDRSSDGLLVLHGEKGQSDNSLENISWGTQKQNCGSDKLRDGTTARGEKIGNSKLKEADIYKIRELRSTGMSQQKIADIFGVNQTQIGFILRGKVWAHLPLKEDQNKISNSLQSFVIKLNPSSSVGDIVAVNSTLPSSLKLSD